MKQSLMGQGEKQRYHRMSEPLQGQEHVAKPHGSGREAKTP